MRLEFDFQFEMPGGGRIAAGEQSSLEIHMECHQNTVSVFGTSPAQMGSPCGATTKEWAKDKVNMKKIKNEPRDKEGKPEENVILKPN